MEFHCKIVLDLIFISTINNYSRRNRDSELDDQVGIIVNNSVLYNAMIHPFTRMVIKGALWYQGMLPLFI